MALTLFFNQSHSFSREINPPLEKLLSQKAKNLIVELKSLAPGGPLSEEETKRIEKELELFEQDYQKGDIKRPNFVKYEDIKKWKLLGDRYALGLNEQGKKLAIFDLSLPDRKSPEFKNKALLALIQTPGYYFRDLISLIRKLIHLHFLKDKC